MAKISDRVLSDADIAGVLSNTRAHAAYALARNKQTTYELLETAATALAQVISERDALRARVPQEA